MSALSNKQKAILAKLARRAWRKEIALARGRGEIPDDTKAGFDAFRREQVTKACGKSGLRLCDQRDYKGVEGHFLDLLGETKQAFNSNVRHATEPKRQAMFNVAKACADWNFNESYADAICQQQFKCSLADAEAWQLDCIRNTVINRGRGKSRKAAKARALELSAVQLHQAS